MKVQLEQEEDGHEVCKRKVLTEVSRLYVGQSFGDMALLDYKPRSATIKCLTHCRFAVIPKMEYQKLFGKIQKKLFDMLLCIIQSISYFKEWSKKDIKRLTFANEEIEFKYGNTVLKQNDPSTHIFIIKEGEFEVLRLVNYKQKLK